MRRGLLVAFILFGGWIAVTSFETNKAIAEEYQPQIVSFKASEVNYIESHAVPEEMTIREWVLNEVKNAGLDPNKASKIIDCESKWNPDAMHINNNGSFDAGLWQINSIHTDISNNDKLDYKEATKFAIKLYQKKGWQPWVCSGILGIK